MSEILKVDDVKPTSIINVDGLNCPLPFFRTKKNIAKLSVGDILQVNGMTTYSLIDIQLWCERNSHFFLGEKEYYGYITIFVKKG